MKKKSLQSQKDRDLLNDLLAEEVTDKNHKHQHTTRISPQTWFIQNFLAVAGLIIAMIGTIAAVIVVPEIRLIVGLERRSHIPIRIDITSIPIDLSAINPTEALRFVAHNINHDNYTENLSSFSITDQELAPLIDGASLFPTSGDLFVDITSVASDEWVKVAPYLVVNIISTKHITETSKYYEFRTIPGHGFPPDCYSNSTGFLSPQQASLFGAVSRMCSQDTNPLIADEVKFDFLTLAPGERASFRLFLQAESGFEYEFRVGVVYIYGEKQEVVWSDKTFTVINPLNSFVWVKDFSIAPTPFHWSGEIIYCDAVCQSQNSAYFRKKILENEEEIKEYYQFPLPKCGPTMPCT